MLTEKLYRPTVVSAAYHFCSPNWTWQVSEFPDLDLWFAFAGKGFLRSGEPLFQVSTGMGFLFAPGDQVAAWTDPKDPLRVCAVHFNLKQGPPPPMSHPFTFRDHALLMALLDQTVKCFQEDHRHRANLWFSTVLDLAVERGEAVVASDIATEQRGKIEAICAQIRRHPQRHYPVSRMADELHVGPDHFARLFKRFKGVSPGRYLVNSRIALARHLLSTSSDGLKQIAAVCGYSSVQFFSRQFKQIVGITPGQYRKSACITE